MNKKPATVKFAPCKECGESFAQKPKDRVFCSDQCRFRFWNKRRMDFRGLAKKVDLILGGIARLEKAVGIKEGGK